MNTAFKSIGIPLSVFAFIALAACGGGGGGSSPPPAVSICASGGGGGGSGPALSFTNGQAADVVVGQPDFITANLGGGGATGFSGLYSSAHVANGNLYVGDDFNNRVMVFAGIPSANGASAAYALGQPDLTAVGPGASSTTMFGPGGPVASGGCLYVSEFNNNRVSIYNALPSGSPGTITTVLGQVNKANGGPGACDAVGMDVPEAVWAVGGKIIVPDGNHNRVLIWNRTPTVDGTPADLVFGAGKHEQLRPESRRRCGA